MKKYELFGLTNYTTAKNFFTSRGERVLLEIGKLPKSDRSSGCFVAEKNSGSG